MIPQIEHDENGNLFVVTREPNKPVHRRAIQIGSDVNGESEDVKDAAAKVWTPERIAAEKGREKVRRAAAKRMMQP